MARVSETAKAATIKYERIVASWEGVKVHSWVDAQIDASQASRLIGIRKSYDGQILSVKNGYSSAGYATRPSCTRA